MTKWKRLFNALAAAQNQHRLGNHLILLIEPRDGSGGV